MTGKEQAMEIMKIVHIYFDYSRPQVKITMCCLYPILVAINMQWASYVGESCNVIQLTTQLILLLIIHIWVYSAPKFYLNAIRLDQIFQDSQYASLCKRHIDLMYQLHFETDSARDSISSIFEIIFKSGFCFFWAFVCVKSAYIFRYLGIFPSNLIGDITIFLFLIALFLNYSSYYTCILLTYFLRQVSNLPNIKELHHNQYIPSSSLGLQRLSANASTTSVVFLIVSMLFTIIHIVTILSGMKSDEIRELLENRPDYFCFVTFSIFILGAGTFLVLYLVPKLFLKRIHRIWKIDSLKKIEGDLRLAEKANDKPEIDRLLTIIDRLNKDNLKIEYSFLEVSVVLTTGMLNIISIILNIQTWLKSV